MPIRLGRKKSDARERKQDKLPHFTRPGALAMYAGFLPNLLINSSVRLFHRTEWSSAVPRLAYRSLRLVYTGMGSWAIVVLCSEKERTGLGVSSRLKRRLVHHPPCDYYY